MENGLFSFYCDFNHISHARVNPINSNKDLDRNTKTTPLSVTFTVQKCVTIKHISYTFLFYLYNCHRSSALASYGIYDVQLEPFFFPPAAQLIKPKEQTCEIQPYLCSEDKRWFNLYQPKLLHLTQWRRKLPHKGTKPKPKPACIYLGGSLLID